MDTEDLMREILSKMCPYHGKHPNIELDSNWKLTVSACCNEFKEMMETIKSHFENKPDWVLVIPREKV
jgi:hypothetical protein